MIKFVFFTKKHIVLAPRGEFSKGAIILKSYKKRLFIFLSNLFRLYKNITWHVSSQFESEDIQRELGILPNDIVIAPNVTGNIPIQSDKNKRVLVKQLSNKNLVKIIFLSQMRKH